MGKSYFFERAGNLYAIWVYGNMGLVPLDKFWKYAIIKQN